jgi:ComF family protein
VVKVIGRILAWPVQAAVDFLIEDRCLLCGEISCESAHPIDSSRRFSAYLACAVHQRAIGFIKIENHPICHACVAGFDETHGTGMIHLQGAVRVSRPKGRMPAETPIKDPPPAPHPSAEVAEPSGNEGSIPVIAPFMTNDPVLNVVHRIKFSAYTALVPLAALSMQAAYEFYGAQPSDDRLFIPVPMHRKQRKERGFNQAELIARELSGRLEIPLCTDILERKRPGTRQSVTPREKRSANVRGVFCAKKGSIAGKHALLVDDLVTSGATAAACAAELYASGAASVTVLCLGRSL